MTSSRTPRAAGVVALVALALTGCSGGAAPAADTDALALGWTDAARGTAVALPHDGLVAGKAVEPKPGQTVLLNYWASTCGPCRAEMPLLQQLADRDVVVVGVTTDRFARNARNAIAKAGVTYANYRDFDRSYATSQLDGVLPLIAVPSSAVIRDGKVVKVHIGPFHSRAELAAVLER